MRKLMSVSLLVTTLLAATQPGWTGKLPKYSTGQQLMQTLRGGNRIRTRSGQEWRLLNDFTRSLTPQALQRQLQTGRSFSALRQLQRFDARRSFSTLTAQQPPLQAVLNMIDIQGFMMQHGDQFPTPQDTQAFKKVLEVLVFAKANQIDGRVKDMLAGLYVGPESPIIPVPLPQRLQDIDAWMENTPPQVQLASVQAGLGKTKKTSPVSGKPSAKQPGANPRENTDPLAKTYYSVQEALERLAQLNSKWYSRNNPSREENALPTPFEKVNDFWAVLSLIKADSEGRLPRDKKQNFLDWPFYVLQEKVDNPQLLRQEVRAWQGVQSRLPSLPDPAKYPSAYNIFKAPPAKKLEWKLAVEMWYLKQLVPEEKQPELLQDWSPYAKQPGGPKLAAGYTDLSKPRQAANPAADRPEKEIRKALSVMRANPKIDWELFQCRNNPKVYSAIFYLLEQEHKGLLTETEKKEFLDLCIGFELGEDTPYTFDHLVYEYKEFHSITTMPYLPTTEKDISPAAISQAPKSTQFLWEFATSLRVTQLLYPEKLEGSRWATWDVFAGPREIPEPPITHIGEPDLSYKAENTDLQILLMRSTNDWDVRLENAAMFPEINKYLSVIKDGLNGELSEGDLEQLYAVFVHSPSNSIEHIQQELAEWQAEINTPDLPDFSSYSYASARNLENNMLRNGKAGALIRQAKEWCLGAKIALAQRIYGLENLPPELRGKVF